MKSVFKKVAGVAIAAAFAVGMAGCTIESDSSSHKHTFATDYSSNATHHWYAATCEHTTEIKDKAEHSFGEWSITTQPTEDAEGTKERECSICYYKAEETIAKLDHVHAKGTHHDAVASSCKTKGTIAYYDCTKAECEIKLDEDGNPLASIESALAPANHEGTATTFETVDADNHKEKYKCCNAVKTESAAHIWNSGVVTKEPTTTEEGVKTFTCTAEGCGQTKMEPVEKLFVPAMVKITGCSTGDFYISNTELTYAKWYEVYQWATSDERGANKYVFQTSGREGSEGYYGMEPSGNSRQPVTYISWRDAVVWCNAASEMEGLTPYYYMEGTDDTEFTDNTKVVRIVDGDYFDFDGAAEKAVFNTTSNGYRLPTKIEWEYAAKGGKNYAYSGSANIDDIAWYSNNSENQTHDVGTKQPNDYGLYDMSGNVGEWCQDNIWWGYEGYCGLGGDYHSQEEGCTISLSELYGPIHPGHIVGLIGFRVCRNAN